MSPPATARLATATAIAAVLVALWGPTSDSTAQPVSYVPPAPGNVETEFVALPATGPAAAQRLTGAQRARLAAGWVVVDQEPFFDGDRQLGYLVTYARR